MAMQRCPSTTEVHHIVSEHDRIIIKVPCTLPYGHEDDHRWATTHTIDIEPRGSDASADYR